MKNESANGSSILRMIGVMGICVGVAWALQILGFGTDGSSPLDRLMWVLAAASVSGASFGLIVVSTAIEDAVPVRADATGDYAGGFVRN